MRRLVRPWVYAAVLLASISAPTRAAEDSAAPHQECEAAIHAAEQRHGIPPGLLDAIGRVETGRGDATGVRRPWPWAANAEGVGRYFASKAEAIDWVRAKQAGGVASIDVGCMQVNLRHHPAAFATLDEAFDPAANADYAARFLASLRAAADGVADDAWMRAAGQYHSGTVALAAPYRQLVEQAYGRAAPAPVPTVSLASGPIVPRTGRVTAQEWARRRAEAALLVAGVPRRGPNGNRVEALVALALGGSVRLATLQGATPAPGAGPTR